MKARLPGLLAAVALVTGCATSHQPAAAPDRSTAGLEHKTDEFVAKADADLRRRMAQWARDGWQVHSISPPMVQPDGTVLRRADLSRSRP